MIDPIREQNGKYFLVTKLQMLPEKFLKIRKLLFRTGGAVLPPDTQVASIYWTCKDSVFETRIGYFLFLTQHALKFALKKVGYLDAYRNII